MTVSCWEARCTSDAGTRTRFVFSRSTGVSCRRGRWRSSRWAPRRPNQRIWPSLGLSSARRCRRFPRSNPGRSPSLAEPSTPRSCASRSTGCLQATHRLERNRGVDRRDQEDDMSVEEHTRIQEVEVQALDAARLEPLIGPDRIAHYEAIAEATESLLRGRAVLNVNSTATGGGVAEMLQTLLAYGRGAGLDVRWLVIQGDPDFFEI